MERARFRGGLDSRRDLPCVSRALPGETNHRGFVSSAHAQPQPIRKLIEWLRDLTLPAGIVRAEGRIEATQVDVSSKDAGEVVDVAVQEGDKVAVGQVIARLSSPQLEAQLRAAQSDLRSAKEARAQDAIKAAEAKVEQFKSMISELTLVSPRDGKVRSWRMRGIASWRAHRS